jgi:hypothetical protein
VRKIVAELASNPNTMLNAFHELAHAVLVPRRSGKGTCVSLLPCPTMFSEEVPMRHRTSAHFARWSLKPFIAGATLLIVVLAAAPLSADANPATSQASTALTAHARTVTTKPCTRTKCTFELKVNLGLGPGKPFFCPAIQQAKATITITNRFVTSAQNDVMTLKAEGLPKNTGFDMFLVQNSAFDANFTGSFGFGWYQSDLQSDKHGEASVKVQGIFDGETFIESPADPFNPIHTFNVGFWFNSPDEEAKVCPSATPAKTPFNGEQNAGLLAMITSGGPLQLVQGL